MTNVKNDLPGLTGDDMDALSSGAGEIGGAIALFAAGDPFSIAQGAIKVGQQAWALGKGLWHKFQKFRSNRRERLAKTQPQPTEVIADEAAGMSQIKAHSKAPVSSSWLVHKPASLGQTSVGAHSKTHSKSDASGVGSFAQTAARIVKHHALVI